MEALIELFKSMIVFTYHCFDRVVINGYLSGLSRPENIVYFFREVQGVPCITKAVLSKRTSDYQIWIKAFAHNHKVPIEWAEKGVRKEEAMRPYLTAMERNKRFGVYFIYKSMEQGNTFRIVEPKFPTSDPNYRIVKKDRRRYTHYYFYIRDEVLGAMIMRVASFLPFQTTYYLNGHNFIERELLREDVNFRKKDNAFLSTNNPVALQQAADRFDPELIRKRLEYWSFLLGPKFTKRQREAMNLHRYYFISQVEYCCNYIFRRHFPIDRLFKRSCEIALACLTAKKISQFFGQRITRRMNGKLYTTLDQIKHGHHVLRAYFKNSFVKQYEKFRTFLRIETCSNNLHDFRLKKGIEHLPLVARTLQAVNNRFEQIQAQSFNVHFDFPIFQHLAKPVTRGRTRIPGIKIQDTRVYRVMETMMHLGSQINGWSMRHIHNSILSAYGLAEKDYTRNQLRYDVRKMKARGLIERVDNHYSYRLTDKGIKTSLLFVLFHKRLCGPVANSLFQYHPNHLRVLHNCRLEKAYKKADHSIQKIVDLLAA